jgi:hypothetical protein
LGPATKRRRIDDETFSITIHGRENYEILHRLRESLEVASAIPHTQFEQLRQQQEHRRRNQPDVIPPPLPLSSASTASLTNGHQFVSNCGLPSPSLPECSITGRSSPGKVGGQNESMISLPYGDVTGASCSRTKRDTVISWLSKHNLSSLGVFFDHCSLVFMDQLDCFGFDDFERLGLTDDKLGAVLVAFFRYRRDAAKKNSPDGFVSLSSSNSSGSLTASHPSGGVVRMMPGDECQSTPGTYEVTRYTFKRMVSLPVQSKDTDVLPVDKTE